MFGNEWDFLYFFHMDLTKDFEDKKACQSRSREVMRTVANKHRT